MWENLLDTNIPIDLQLLDNAAAEMYRNQQNQEIISIIERVTARDDFFSCIDKILDKEYSLYLKYIALTVFNKFVSNNWGNLQIEHSEYYKNFIAQFTMKPFSQSEKPLLYMADTVLINILLYEWPDKWPTFIQNILSVASNSPELCQNSLKVIRMLVEEFTDFSENSMTTVRQAEMNFAFVNQFSLIHPVVLNALSSRDDDLIIEALNCMKTFLNVVDPEVIFTQDMINVLTNEFLPNPKFMIYCISIISIIPSHHAIFDESINSFITLFYAIIQCLSKIFINDNMFDIETNSELTPSSFIHIFITSMTKLLPPFILSCPTIEKSEPYALCLKWIFNITCQIQDESDNMDDFNDLVEFWHMVVRSLYYEINSNHETNSVYYPFLSILRRFYLSRMVEPYINNTRIDEDGIHYHRYDLTQEANTYNLMRETLVFMHHIDSEDTLKAISEKLEEIRSTQSLKLITSFSWAIGSIPGTIPESQELKVISEILQTFLAMVASSPIAENIESRTVLTRAILHICSQYGQMLSNQYELLKVVLNKMLEFSQEQYPPIQDAAVQALLQIGRYSTKTLATRQQNEDQSFLEMLLSKIYQLLSPLSQDNIIAMIEFFSFLITAVSSDRTKREMTSLISGIINEKLQLICQNIQFDDPNWFNNFIFIVDCNTQIITYLYYTYSKCFIEIYPAFVHVYMEATEKLNTLVDFPNTGPYNFLKKLKAAVIHLFTSFIECSKEKTLSLITENPIINVFIKDYANSPVKTPEIISLVSSTCMKMNEFFQNNYQLIMEAIVAPSLPLMQEPGDFPEIWPEFCKFLLMYFQQNIDFLSNNNESLMVMFNLLKKACSHPVQKVSDHAMMTLSSLVSNVEYNTQAQLKKEFFNMISIDIFVFITSLLIDGIHKFLFNNIMNLMRRLIQMDEIKSRADELMGALCNLLPNRKPKEIHDLIAQMIELSKSKYNAFKELIRNFVIMARKYAPGDPAMRQPDIEEYKQKLLNDNQVPGLVLADKLPKNQKEASDLAAAFSNFHFQPQPG